MTHAVTRLMTLLGLTATFSMMTAWAVTDMYSLQGMTFEQVQSGTKIVLEGSAGLPYRLINSNDKNITLEIDSIDPEKAIATDFSRSDSIHHVTLKPLSAHSLKVSIFGDKLGHPFITFDTSRPSGLAASTVAHTATPVTQNETTPEAYALEAFSGVEDPAPVAAALPEAGKEVSAETSATTTLENQDRQAFTSTESVFPENKVDDSEDTPFPENLLLLLGKTLVESPTTLLYVVIGGLGLILGLYSITKLASLFKQRHAASNRVKNLLNLNGNKNRQNPFGHSPFSKGLNGPGLQQQAPLQQHAPLQSQPNLKPTSHQPLPGLNPSTNHLIAKTQAEQQYQRANQSVPERKPVDREKLDTELKRSIEMKYAWGRQNNPAPSKWTRSKQSTPQFPTSTQNTLQQAARSGNGPQENKEVISFLRSVAELMEKDGKSELANEIKKTLT